MKYRHKQWINPNAKVILRQILIGLLVISFVALLITGIWYGTRIEALTINNIEIVGGETIKHSQVREFTEQALTGNYLGVVPKRFAWFYPEDEILTLLQKIERIHDISFEQKNSKSGNILLITFDEYVPRALWCKDLSDNECLFLDKNGYAFAHAPRLSGGSFLRFVTIDTDHKLHETVTNIEWFDSLLEISELLGKQNWYVSKIEFDKIGDAFIHLTEGGELKVSIQNPPTTSVENLLVILSSDEFSHLKPGNFQYIDLRFGSKVFVNEEKVVQIETSTSTVNMEIDR